MVDNYRNNSLLLLFESKPRKNKYAFYRPSQAMTYYTHIYLPGAPIERGNNRIKYKVTWNSIGYLCIDKGFARY